MDDMQSVEVIVILGAISTTLDDIRSALEDIRTSVDEIATFCADVKFGLITVNTEEQT